METNIIEQNGKRYRVTIVEEVEEVEAIQKKVTYEDVVKEIMPLWTFDHEFKTYATSGFHEACLHSKEAAERITALIKLENTAKYLNEVKHNDVEWGTTKSYFGSIPCVKLFICWLQVERNLGFVLFKNDKIAEEAVEILGEETIKMALK